MMHLTALDLGANCVRGLIEKTRLDPKLVDAIIWGNVVLCTAAPNVAREIVVDLNLPPHIHGVTVSRACLSGLEAIEQAVAAIERGDCDVAIAGGSDSMSNGEMSLPRHLTHALAMIQYGKAKNPLEKALNFFRQAGSPLSWIPKPPAIAERSTGKLMGYHADLMAEINHISRNAQDAFAVDSHRKANQAKAAGWLAEEITPVESAKKGTLLSDDNIIRAPETDEAAAVGKLSKLRPAFRKTGTVSAASSSPLTDGGSAVLLMSEEKARLLGYPMDISLKAWVNIGVDPYPQLLLAPAYAIPRALQKAGLSLADIDIFEIHEAFAAQVLSTIAVLANPDFCHQKLGMAKGEVVGNIPLSKVNLLGSSIAIGHPFAATGGRIVGSVINQLRRDHKRYALISICAAGGLGGVAIVERIDS